MGMGSGGRSIFDVMFNRDRNNPSQAQYFSVAPRVYDPQNYIQQMPQTTTQYMPGQSLTNPYAEAYLGQLAELQQAQTPQQNLTPNLASGLAALAEAYGLANPVAATAQDSNSAAAPAGPTAAASE
jgi:murein DD-endopeptidase MepM/ murein hydrolase activator NlpD